MYSVILNNTDDKRVVELFYERLQDAIAIWSVTDSATILDENGILPLWKIRNGLNYMSIDDYWQNAYTKIIDLELESMF